MTEDQVSDESIIELVREAGGTLAIPSPGGRYTTYEGVSYGISQLKRICRSGALRGHTRTEAHWDGALDPQGRAVYDFVFPRTEDEIEAIVQRSLGHWDEARLREQERSFRGYPSTETREEAEARFRTARHVTHEWGPTGEFEPVRPNKGTLVFWVLSLPE